MAKLTAKLGEWDLPHVDMWKDRQVEIKFEKKPLINKDSRIATIGSCFAAELAAAIERLKLKGAMHPAGLVYNTSTIRQEVERIFGGWREYKEEPNWKVKTGYVNPFKDHRQSFNDEKKLKDWSDKLDKQAEELFQTSDIIVITLGLIESWRNPKTGNFFTAIPHPDVFPTLGAEFHRLTVSEMIEDLTRIRKAIKENTKAEIIFTVSPVPLHSTMTTKDVRVANTESKSRIRAAVSEFIEQNPDVHYFHSYEIVMTAERLSDFMMEDGRHVHRHAVDYIIRQFLLKFADERIVVPDVDDSWLTRPTKTAERVVEKRSLKKKMRYAWAKISGK